MSDLKRPFVAMRQDPRWVRKMAVAAALNLVPYLGAFIVIGWQLDYFRRAAWGDDEHLPDWTPFEPHLLRGVYAFVAILPLSMALSLVIIPLSFLATGAAVLIPAFGKTGVVLFFVVIALVMLLSLASGYAIVPLTYSIYAQVGLYERLDAAFQYREMWARLKSSGPAMRRAWLNSVIVSLASLPPMLLYMASSFVWMTPLVAMSGDRPDSAAVLGWTGVGLLLSVALSIVSFALIAIVGVVVGLANAHYWATWAREAYGLGAGEAPAEAAATAAAPEEPVPAETT